MSSVIDLKIRLLRLITNEFLFIEFSKKKNKDVWKIRNEFATFKNKIILCDFKDGIEQALNVAIRTIVNKKKQYFKNNFLQYCKKETSIERR